MNRTSSLMAALALGTAGIAFAQGNPPTTIPPNPATAAGQQNPTGGPMGTTGTTPQNTSPSGSTAAPMAQSSQGMSSSSSTMAAEPAPMRQARADRN